MRADADCLISQNLGRRLHMTESDGYTIKVGELVICIDDRADPPHYLRHGNVYTVEAKLQYALILGNGRTYSPDRFERMATK
jgi:hypothetical protein